MIEKKPRKNDDRKLTDNVDVDKDDKFQEVTNRNSLSLLPKYFHNSILDLDKKVIRKS